MQGNKPTSAPLSSQKTEPLPLFAEEVALLGEEAEVVAGDGFQLCLQAVHTVPILVLTRWLELRDDLFLTLANLRQRTADLSQPLL